MHDTDDAAKFMKDPNNIEFMRCLNMNSSYNIQYLMRISRIPSVSVYVITFDWTRSLGMIEICHSFLDRLKLKESHINWDWGVIDVDSLYHFFLTFLTFKCFPIIYREVGSSISRLIGPIICLDLKQICECCWPMLFKIFKNVDGCMSDPLQVVHFLRIRPERSSIFEESEQHSLWHYIQHIECWIECPFLVIGWWRF